MTWSKPFTYRKFKEIYSKVPRLCVDLVVETQEGIVLTLRAIHPWVGQWHLPGGTVYYRESIEDAARRIAKEELGISVHVKELLGYGEYFSEKKKRGFGYAVSLFLLCNPGKGKMRLNKEASKVGVFSKLPKNTIKEHTVFLNKYLSNKK